MEGKSNLNSDVPQCLISTTWFPLCKQKETFKILVWISGVNPRHAFWFKLWGLELDLIPKNNMKPKGVSQISRLWFVGDSWGQKIIPNTRLFILIYESLSGRALICPFQWIWLHSPASLVLLLLLEKRKNIQLSARSQSLNLLPFWTET